ncbi:MAG: sigma-70 family RNA polymerase sigma factor [Thermodesulfobacteriota bacterium]
MFGFRSRRDFQELTSPHVRFLYNMAFRYTGNSYDAEDLVQETMYSAYKNFSSLREKQKCKAWLLTILRRRFFKEQSQSKKQPFVLDDEAYLHLIDRYAGAEHQLDMERQETASEVHHILSGLSEKYKTPLLLFFMEDMSYQDISDALELPMGTVMSRLSRAKQHFKKGMLQLAVRENRGAKVIPLHPDMPLSGKAGKKEVAP